MYACEINEKNQYTRVYEKKLPPKDTGQRYSKKSLHIEICTQDLPSTLFYLGTARETGSFFNFIKKLPISEYVFLEYILNSYI